MIITTTKAAESSARQEAELLALSWGASFKVRKKRSIQKWLLETGEAIYVVGDEADTFHPPNSSNGFFFHPSMAKLRGKRVLDGGRDPLIEAGGIEEGMSILDCTLGLGSDSIVLSAAAGETGYVQALEKTKEIEAVVKKGLQYWNLQDVLLNEAMQRIRTAHADYSKWLREAPTASWDVVYFDPMFHEALTDSSSMGPLRGAASYGGLQVIDVQEALRVCRNRVVFKEHSRSPVWEAFPKAGRKKSHAAFAYGILEKDV